MAEQKRGRLAGAILNYGIGSYIPRIVNFILIPLYTRYLTPSDYGIVEVYLTIGATLVILMRAGLPGSVGRLYFDYEEGPEVRDLYTTVAVALTVTSLFAVGLFALVGPPLFAARFPETPIFPHFWIVLVSSFCSAAPLLQQRILQAREQSRKAAGLNAFYGLFSAVSTFLFVVFFIGGSVGVLTANLISNIAFLIASIALQRDDLRGKPRWKYLKAAANYGVPLVPHHLAAAIHSYIGRWLLNATASAAAVGHLAIAARLASPIMVVTGAYSNAYSPIYFSWRTKLDDKDALREARRVGQATVVFGGIGVIGAATFGTLVVRHALPDTYAPSAPLIGVVAAALFVHLAYVHLVTEVFYAKRTKWISVIFVLSASVNIGVLLLLVDTYGAMAAAVAQVAGSVASAGLAAVLARRTFPLALTPRPFFVAAVGAGGACAIPILYGPAALLREAGVMTASFIALTAMVLLLSGAGGQIWADASGLVRRRIGRSGANP